jgi:predicted DNA-binding protein with PD1-like motif
MAKAVLVKEYNQDYEIVSITGTIAKGKAHIHLSCSDESGAVIGGHLVNGTIINTTCELVLMEIEKYDFSREFDENTGYKELIVKLK